MKDSEYTFRNAKYWAREGFKRLALVCLKSALRLRSEGK